MPHAVQTVEGYARARQPFLLSLHFTAPHWPWEGPDDEEESRRIRNTFHRDGGSQKTYAAMMALYQSARRLSRTCRRASGLST